jgi:pimeloyl-ACP methyl ester carboxylesterase
MFARLYAQTHPDEVAGLVLVDTFSPEVPAIFGEKWPAYRDLLSSTRTQGDPAAERIDLDACVTQLQQAPAAPRVLSKTEPFGVLPATMPAELTATDIERFWPQVQAGVVQIAPQAHGPRPTADRGRNGVGASTLPAHDRGVHRERGSESGCCSSPTSWASSSDAPARCPTWASSRKRSTRCG